MTDFVLHTENLCKNYAGLAANTNLNLQLIKGEIHALIGPNGAGKSTAIAQLSGELPPSSGKIYFNSKEVTGTPVFDRAQMGISRSFQVTSVFDEMTVLENLALAIQAHHGHSYFFWRNINNNKELNKQACELAQQFGLEQHHKLLAGALAHGEKRQLEVAMTLAGDPQVLLLDEPMAGIGPGGSKELTQLLDGLRGRYSILLVEHDMDAVFALADRISVLVYGEIIATGTVDEIRNNENVQKAYLGHTESSC
ncbi:MAG: ABC transporter ATP-binding protein [Gammaproteobacteria bacterium]|jgi:branched-chain amino acid transport system ATP-binding protein|nr:ABC transporter ATP-binding protein [Gammaproteobacteria bacterium]MBT3723669.1 ABC transporter ATP-binding protein [Gammaproteobacteria bacterium]MBT4194130.1 ABC transporter ATP-binding protein [Gammaproteobacteria bacterium]MBT4450672.1 ABC transporter ATP-binding protein [Gammaproteobacteria bacterium]MBT4859984.1 ABC transporter ATP-binding protein [Gammaproteobacteria bacterium]